MKEQLDLKAMDIIRHKRYPQGPEWKVLCILSTEHGIGYLLRMNPPGPFYWVVRDMLFRSTSGIETGFTYDVEDWAMKKVSHATEQG